MVRLWGFVCVCVCGDESLGPPRAKKVFASSKTRRNAGEKADRRGDALLRSSQCGGGLPEVEGGARMRLGARKESIVSYKTRFFGRLGIAAVAAVGGLWW